MVDYEKHEICAAAFSGHLFMTYFCRAEGGGMTPLEFGYHGETGSSQKSNWYYDFS